MAKKKPKKALKKKPAKNKRKPVKKPPVRAKKRPAKKRAPPGRAPPKKKRAPAKKAVRPKPKTRNIRPKTPPRPRISPALEMAPAKKPPTPAPETEGPIEVTPEIRRMWIRIRQAWVVSYQAFNHSVAMLDDRQANLMYDVVKHSLFKGTHAEILREHPGLKELIRTDDDRLCMHDVYERLSFRLNRYEKLPPDKRVYRGMKGMIGRNLPDLEV